jgi:hypothetical protein
VVAHTSNPGTRETEAGGSLVPGQPRLHNKSLSQKRKEKRKEGKERKGKEKKST